MKKLNIFGLIMIGLALAAAGVYTYCLNAMAIYLNPQVAPLELTTLWRTGAVELETPLGWSMRGHRTKFTSFLTEQVRDLVIEERPYPVGRSRESVFNDRVLSEPFQGIKAPQHRVVELAKPNGFPRPLKAVARLNNLTQRAYYHVFILYRTYYLYISFMQRPEDPNPDNEQDFHSAVLAEQLAGLEDLYLDDQSRCGSRDMFTAFGCARPDPNRFQISQQLGLADDAGKISLTVWSEETGLHGPEGRWRLDGFDPYLNDYRALTSRLMMSLDHGLHPQTIEHDPVEINGLKAVRQVVVLYKMLPWGMYIAMPVGEALLKTDLYLGSGRSTDAETYDTRLSCEISAPASEAEAGFNRVMGTVEQIWSSVRAVSTGTD